MAKSETPTMKRSSEDPLIVPKAKRSQAQIERAAKACSSCRKSKTKCLKTSNIAVSCIRCQNANQLCSLEVDFRDANPGIKVVNGVPEHLLEYQAGSSYFMPGSDRIEAQRASDHVTSQKIDHIYHGVLEMLAMMKGHPQSASNSDVRLLLDAANSMKDKRSETPGFMDSLPQGSGGFWSNNKFPPVPSLVPNFSSESAPSSRSGAASPPDSDGSSIFVSSGNCYKSSAMYSVVNSVSEAPHAIAGLLGSNTEKKPQLKAQYDIISCGIVTENEAITLMDDFRSNYGRWVSFSLSVSTADLVDQIRKKSSFLLTTCCTLSLRYSLNGKPSPGDIDSYRRKKNTFSSVIKHLVKDLDKALVKYACFPNSSENGGDVEFLQAMVILSIYSLSLSSVANSTYDPESILEEDAMLQDLNLDPWHLSGIGISTFVSKLTFGGILAPPGTASASTSPSFNVMYDGTMADDSQTLTLLRIYNHLILIHLVSCVLSGRMCMVDEIRLNYCTSALSLPSATNFDGRMVSEIGILLITYNYIQINSNTDSDVTVESLNANLQSVHDDIQLWYEQWRYLFEQPALQFVEFCYNFCHLQIAFNYVYMKNQIVARDAGEQEREVKGIKSLVQVCDKDHLLKLLEHSFNIVSFVDKVDDDSYFAYLSDQVHFFFFYGAMSLMASLHQLQQKNYLSSLSDLKLPELSEENWTEPLKFARMLADKFDTIAQGNPSDIMTKYKNGIMEMLRETFPDYA